MKKLLNRKGFTMVELIVVIALLGLMLAIVIPMLSTTDARKNEVREYARSFYSNVQELMIDEKLAKNDLPGTYTLVCAQVDRDVTDYSGVTVWMSFASDPSAFASNLDEMKDTDPTIDNIQLAAGTYKPFEEFVNSLRKLLLGNERTGWYYAIVDEKYRVVSAYFVEGKDSDFAAVNGKTFTSDYMIDDNYAGAWPEEMSSSGKIVFDLPA